MTPDIDPLPPELSALLDAERARPAPLPAIEERVFSRLAGSVGAMPMAPAAPPGPLSAASNAPSLGSRLLHSGIARGAALVAAGAVGGVGLHAALRPPRAERVGETQVVSIPVPTFVSVPKPQPIIVPEPLPTPARPAPARGPGKRHEDQRARDRELAAERVLVEQARTALSRGEVRPALEALARHEHDYPQGQLVEEREALTILGLAALGKKDEAQARAAAFRTRFPRSILLRSINNALAP